MANNIFLLMGGKESSSTYSTKVDVFQATDTSVEYRNLYVPLKVARADFATASCGKYAFAFGGSTSGGLSDAIDVFEADTVGIVKRDDLDLTLSVARTELAAASCGNYILAMGGVSGTGYSDIVDVFEVKGTGIEKRTDLNLTLSVARYRLAAASCGKFILAMGGDTDGVDDSDVVDVFEVSDSTVTKVDSLNLKLSVARWGLAATSCGKYIFAMGGYGGHTSNAVDVFEVSDSTVNKVDSFNLKLSVTRSPVAAASCDNYVLCMGGHTSTVDVFEVTDTGIVRKDSALRLSSLPSSYIAAASAGKYIVTAGGYFADESKFNDAVDVFEVVR